MCKRIHDIIGQKYGELTVKGYSHKDSASRNYFTCICNCGKTKIIQQSNLLSGRSTSCGCSRGQTVAPLSQDHDVLRVSDRTLTEVVCVDIGTLPALTSCQQNSMTNHEMDAFRLINKTYLVEVLFLMKGDRVMIKESGMYATANKNVTHDSCFDVTLDDGTTDMIFCVDDVWKLVQVR